MKNNKLSITENIKRRYYYLFFTLYKWYENSPFVWLSEWKASLSLDIIVFLAFFPIILYYNLFIDNSLRIENDIVIIKWMYVILVIIPNTIIFNYKNNWKKIIRGFESLPQEQHKTLGKFSWMLIILIVIHFIFVLYLMFQKKW